MAHPLTKRLLNNLEFARVLETDFPKESQFLIDVESDNRMVVHRLDSVVFRETSPFQEICIFRAPHLGLTLALDGIIQLSQTDESLYHELLIHPACLLIPSTRSALILGGGDGCAARELLKYGHIEDLDLVEIDEMVVSACRRHLGAVNLGALEDPRLKISIADAEKFLLMNPDKRYDLIVADLTEPYDPAGLAGDLSRHVFSPKFYGLMKRHLTEYGIFVIQTGGISGIPETDRYHIAIVKGLRESFPFSETCYQYVHSFDLVWSVTLASNHPYDLHGFDPDAELKTRGISSLRHYDGISHVAAFQMPRRLRNLFTGR
jgi:spermidine synthase